MSAPRTGRLAVTMFTGGRGGASIARHLLRTGEVALTLVINGYDNGLSTGAVRRFVPGMLGPSDFRKNLALHLDRADPEQAALIAVLQHRLPPDANRREFDRLVEALDRAGGGPFAALPDAARTAILTDLAVLDRRFDRRPGRLDLSDCALGNLVFAGAYLRLSGAFNAAVRSCARTFGSPAELANVTNGENAYLVALKQDGRLLADEAEIVAPQDTVAITDLFLLREQLTPRGRAELAARPVERLRESLARRSASVSLSPQARSAIEHCDLLVYGPGTPHSSLLPSYLTPGVGEAVAASRAGAKVFVVNTRDDNDVRGLSAADLVDRTLAYLGDPFNERRTVTHVLCHRAGAAVDAVDNGTWLGAQWIVADLEDSDRPGSHCGRRTVSALTGIAGAANLVRLG
jgi:2-phospho-L-lactate transferase/gluconeogenesis factor (CofD/UPF0052 family)